VPSRHVTLAQVVGIADLADRLGLTMLVAVDGAWMPWLATRRATTQISTSDARERTRMARG